MPAVTLALRDNAREFIKNRYSNHQEVDRFVNWIVDEIVKLRSSRNIKTIHRESWVAHTKSILLDVYCAYLNPPYIYLAISRRAADYTNNVSRYNSSLLSYRYTISVLDYLVELHFIEQFPGFYVKTLKSGYLTRICATGYLIELMDFYGVRKEMISRLPIESIKLRDSKKKFVEYEDTDTTNQMRRNLNDINQSIGKRHIRLGADDREMNEIYRRMAHDQKRGVLNFDAVELYRVFNNNSFEQGGRFYGGWWQQIPKEYRPYIYIDYKNTMEVDYSGLHIRMLYANARFQCPDDPYDIDGLDRDDQKTAILSIINASDRKKAVDSLKRKGIKNANFLCDALIDRHRPISENFYTGIGTKLQFLDSKVAELVMLKIIKLGGIALPVHDSFIVRIGREDELENAMNEAFQEVFLDIPSRQKRKLHLLEIQAKKIRSLDEFQFVSTKISDWSSSQWERTIRIDS